MEKEEKKTNKPNEPSASYKSRTITFFKSFEEQEHYEIKKKLALSPEERMELLEKFRKFFLKEYLLPDGSWRPLPRTIKIHKPKCL